MRKGRPELLAPAGSYEAILAAASAGADAVYVGGALFGARAYAKNLSEEELLQAIDYLHIRGKKLYLTVNTLLKNKEMDQLYAYIAPLYAQGLDAVIVQDLGVLSYLSEQFPGLPIHASTQMTITGLSGIQMLERMQVKRTVLARELSLPEISHICHNTDMEIECFIHGALCYCYSGQCLMSSILGGRSGNRGRCAQPCRLTYDAYQNGQKINPRKDTYLLSPRDICTIDLLPDLLEAGVTSLKIEGRMKRAEYTAGVVSIYRKYLDLLEAEGASSYRVQKEDREVLEQLYTRSGCSEGYLRQHNGPQMMTLKKPDYTTSEESFYDFYRKKYITAKNQENINGKLKLLKGKPLTLEVETSKEKGSAHAVLSGALVQTAQKQPLTLEKVSAQMQKTGNTPFVFENLQVEMEPDVFVPVQELNALRREALEQLEEQLLAPYKRPYPSSCIDLPSASGKEKKAAYTFTVSAERLEQLDLAVREPKISDIYISFRLLGYGCKDLEAVRERIEVSHKNYKKCYLLMPYILREPQRRLYEKAWDQILDLGLDGMVVRNMDSLGFLQDMRYEGEIRADYTLYTMNDTSCRALHAWISRDTVPLELNAGELMRRDASSSEMLVYGYIPLMLSAQCIAGNLGNCRKDSGQLTLKDRYQKEFIVQKDCDACMNILYNSAPLALDGCQDKIKKIAPASIRLSFTLESAKETSRILNDYVRSFGENKKNPEMTGAFTRGHFHRGVE